MELLLNWILGNLGWEGLKKLFSRRPSAEVRILTKALQDAQDRNRDLIQDTAFMELLVEQRNALFAELTEARRRIAELEAECVQLRGKTG